jgi:antitoxin component of RelBE/YafQ-DinJ toxin-antitoxin module
MICFAGTQERGVVMQRKDERVQIRMDSEFRQENEKIEEKKKIRVSKIVRMVMSEYVTKLKK